MNGHDFIRQKLREAGFCEEIIRDKQMGTLFFMKGALMANIKGAKDVEFFESECRVSILLTLKWYTWLALGWWHIVSWKKAKRIVDTYKPAGVYMNVIM